LEAISATANKMAGLDDDHCEDSDVSPPYSLQAGNPGCILCVGDKGLPVADSLLVKVTTDLGVEGWGEAFGFRAVRSAKLAVEELIAPLCIGKDATQITPLMREVQQRLHIFSRTGPLFYGISAVDIALWGIAGKVANAPVGRLLGSGASDVGCYASLIRYSDPLLVRANVRRALETGFRSLKLHEIDLPGDSCRPRRGRPRRRVNPRCELCLDIERGSNASRRTQGIRLEVAGGADVAA
jgi:L-alanine-DL-glutamate epimerase-like enolase superfamily enzyme